MKINRMKTSQLTETLTRLATIRPHEHDHEKKITRHGKGDESGSLYAKHLREELARRAA